MNPSFLRSIKSLRALPANAARHLSLAAVVAACLGGAADAASTVTLSLVPNDIALRPGELLDVVVHLGVTTPAGEATPQILGAQFELLYETSLLEVVVPDTIDSSVGPLSLLIVEATPVGALKFGVISGPPDYLPYTGNSADVAVVHFRVKAGAAACQVADIVRFNAIDPSANNVGVLDRNSPPMIALVNLPAIVLDGVNPTLTVLPEVVSVPTDAGSLVGAVIALPDLNPADNCDISPTVTRITTLPNGSTTTAWPAEFPIGVSSVVWTATDDAGNSFAVKQRITVENYQLLQGTVQFLGTFARAAEIHSRTVCFKAGSMPVTTLEIEINSSGMGVIDPPLRVPVASRYGCASAKDLRHSLTNTVAPTIVGTDFHAAFELIQGDSNNDDLVDIVDFSYFVLDSGIAYVGGRSNFNGDGIVGNADFSFISVNFWLSGDACSGAANALAPRSRVSVKELRRQGLGQLALADLNGDGWVDQQDIQTLLENGLEQGRVTVTKPGRIQLPRW